MGRPLNVYELDWLKEENERLKKEAVSDEQLRARIRQLEEENYKLKEELKDAHAPTDNAG